MTHTPCDTPWLDWLPFNPSLRRSLPHRTLRRRLFAPRELNELLNGGSGGLVDARDMRRWAQYSGGYTPDSSTIKIFWKVCVATEPGGGWLHGGWGS